VANSIESAEIKRFLDASTAVAAFLFSKKSRFSVGQFQGLLVQRELLVGARGFEPRTPCAQGRCATRLRYAPTVVAELILKYFRTSFHLETMIFGRNRVKTVSISCSLHGHRGSMRTCFC
jgi:hypothetical protein